LGDEDAKQKQDDPGDPETTEVMGWCGGHRG
jgi:hypothetical protein